MIFKKLKWLLLILHNGNGSIQKASSKIKRLGKSVSQRHYFRETEKPPLTMTDEKPTVGTSTSKKDQDGHGMTKSENFLRVPKTDDELIIFCQDGHGVMNVDFFRQFFFFLKVSYTAHPSLLFSHGHFETIPDCDFTDDPVHMFLPYFPVLKAQDTRNSAHASRSLAIWPSQMQTQSGRALCF